MNFTRTWAITRKELLHIGRDKRSLIMALGVPFLLLILFCYALSLDVDRVPTYIYDQDRSPESRDLIARFAGSRYFDIRSRAESLAEIDAAIVRGDAILAMVIPPRFSERLITRHPEPVQLILDGADSNTASIAQAYALNTVSAFAAERFHVKPAVEAQMRVWYNSSLISRNFIVPGLVAVILMIIAALLTSLTIAREWESGTMEQLLSTPLRPAEMVLGKLAAFFVLGVADAVIAIGAAVWIFDVPFRGSVVFLGGATALFLFGAFSWGIFISSVANSQLLAYQMGLLSTFLPAFLLSGFIYAIENMPLPIRVVSNVTPSKYFVTILKGSFLKGVGFETLWPQIAFLSIYAALVATLAIKRLRTKVA
ncbi:MAG: ABC transporter permease [Bryobacteraceae bacterium]